jgi:hypothetical protein
VTEEELRRCLLLRDVFASRRAAGGAGPNSKNHYAAPDRVFSFAQSRRDHRRYISTMAAPAPVPCSEKRGLIMRFTAAVRECNRLQTEQIKAVLRGEGFLLEAQIAQAMERRERTKYAVMEHQLRHGC